MRWIIWTITVVGVALPGCATRPEDVSATYVSPLQYQNYNCNQIGMEIGRVSRRVSEISGAQNSTATGDAVALGVGFIFWPAFFFMIGGDHEDELARLKGEYEALESAAIQNECNIGPQLEAARIERERRVAEKAEAAKAAGAYQGQAHGSRAVGRTASCYRCSVPHRRPLTATLSGCATSSPPCSRCPAPPTPPTPSPGPIVATVISVYDDDTLTVNAYPWPGMTIRTAVRVNGIDTPEIRGLCDAEKELAKRARDM